MNIRNLLLAGTAATALAAPIPFAYAQSGSSGTLETAQVVLPEQCQNLEPEEIEACLAELGLTGPDGEPEESAPEEAEQPSGEAEPSMPEMLEDAPAEEEAAPAPEPEPQAEPESEAQPEPEAEPAPEAGPAEQFLLPEQCQDVAPEDVQACIEGLLSEEGAQEAEPESEPEAAPEPAPEAEPQAEPEPEVLPEMLPEPEAGAPDEEPAEEAPAPQERPETLEAPAEEEMQSEQILEPEAEAPADRGAPQGLATAAGNYDAAASEFRTAVETGGDVAAARENLLAAQSELESVCAAVGMDDLEVCLATFGIRADIISSSEIEAAADVGAEAETEVQPAEETEAAPLEEGVLGEVLPEGVESDAVAPLLDSAKDALTGGEEPAPEAPAESQPEEQAQEPAPAPQSDAEAQSFLEDIDIAPITAEEGTRREETVVIEDDDDEADAEVVGRVQSDIPQNLNVIEQRGLSLVFEFNNHLYIDTPDTDRLYYENDEDYYIEDLPNGRTREVILRADGSRIVTVRDRYGEIVRRSRIEPDGTEILLVYVDERYNRYDERGYWIDPGSQLPPLVLTIPPQDYVLDASAADAERVEQFLYQPPVEQIQRYYTLDEVKRSARIRDMVRRLEIGDLTFATDSAAIPPDQVQALSAVANAMLDLLEQNPAETFLIEGHTDAVGSDLYNLELSDRRAESVAYALTRVYGIPAENLATQGYGERYLKVNTPLDERINRRVTIRRITPLITPVAQVPAG